MSNIFNIPSKNSYLTTKQWDEIVDYVNNKNTDLNMVNINETSINMLIKDNSLENEILTMENLKTNNPSILTFSARAATEGYYTLESENKSVTYTTLNAAMESASATDTIYVYGQVTESTSSSAANRKLNNYNITITKDPDYNGRAYIWFTGTLGTSATAYIVVYTPSTNNNSDKYQQLTITGQLSIVAPRTETNVSAQDDGKPLINIRNNGKLILDNGAELVYGYDTVKVDDTANFTLNNGTIRKGKNSCIYLTGNSTANINNGEIRGSDGSGTTTTLTTFITLYGIYMEGNAKVFMSNGKIFSVTNHCVHIEGGNFEMTGGKIFPHYESQRTSIVEYGLLDSDLTENKLIEILTTEYADIISAKKTANVGVYVTGNGLFDLQNGEIFGFYKGNCAYVIGNGSISDNIEARRPAIHCSGGLLYSSYAPDGAGIKLTNNMEDVSTNLESYAGSIAIMNGGSIERNVADNGGGIRVERNSSFYLNGGCITKNIAIDNGTSSDGGSGGGGGVRLVGAEFIMNNGTISYNKAFGINAEQKYNGGGIGAVWQLNYGNIDTKLVINGGNIVNNWSNKNGGAISATNKKNDTGGYDASINVHLYGGTIANNTTNDSGGAIYVGGGNLIIHDGILNDNKAEINGGAVYVEGSFTLHNGSIVSNVTNNNGGAIYVTTGDVNIKSGIITDNIALNNGGAIFVTDGNVILGTEECHDAGESSTHIHPIIQNNIASNGGGVYIDGGSTTMWCGNINQNHTHDGTVNVLVVNGQFIYNGGTIGMPYNSGVVIKGGTFEDNTIEYTGAIKHELHYCSGLIPNGKSNVIEYNALIPESKWIASPRGNILNSEDCDSSSPIWGDLFPNYEFVGWESNSENDTEEIVNLYAIWEKR